MKKMINHTEFIEGRTTIKEIKLLWDTDVDYDLCAFYICNDGTVGSVVPKDYTGLPSYSPYMFLNGVCENSQGNSYSCESITVRTLDGIRSLYIVALNYGAAIEDGVFIERGSLKIELHLSDTTCFEIGIDVDEGEKGDVWVGCRVTHGLNGLAITSDKTFMSLSQAVESIPDFSRICAQVNYFPAPPSIEQNYIFHNSALSVAVDDILNSKSDVIVSCDNFKIMMNGGISAAIRKKGGEEIRHDALKHEEVSLGDVIVTTAGDLSQKYIYHCITTHRRQSSKNIIDGNWEDLMIYIIQHSVDKCFQLLNAMNLNSIAFPTIGAGHAGIPLRKVLDIMVNTIVKNLLRTNRTISVRLCLYDQFGQIDLMKYVPLFSRLAVLSEKTKDVLSLNKPLAINESIPNGIDVFISYSRVNSQEAETVLRILSDSGISYWIDKDGVYSGDNFKETIVDAIDSSKAVIFLSSESSNSSRYCIREVEYAVRENKLILPICIDSSPYAKSLRMDLVNLDNMNFEELEIQKEKLLISIRYAREKSKR